MRANYHSLKKKGFTVKTEALSRKKLGKREYLNDVDSKDLMGRLNRFFESRVEKSRIRRALTTSIARENHHYHP